MKQTFAIVIVSALALAACGGKAKKSTLPENKGGATQTEVGGSSQTSGGANGGATYGGAMTPSSGGTADPCAGQ